MIRFLQKLWYLIGPYRYLYALGLAALLAADVLNVFLPLLLKRAIDTLQFSAPVALKLRTLYFISFLTLALMLLQAATRYSWRWFLMGGAFSTSRDLRSRVFGHLLRLPFSFFLPVRTGDLLSRVSNDVDSIRLALGPGILVAADAVFMFLLIVPAMLWLSVPLTLLSFCFFPFLPWVTRKIGGKIEHLFEESQSLLSRMTAVVQEAFVSIKVVKSMRFESQQLGLLEKWGRQFCRVGRELALYEALLAPLLGFLTNLGIFAILAYGSNRIAAGTLTLGTFIAFQRFVNQLSWPMEAIGWAVTMHTEGAASLRRMDQLLENPRAPIYALQEMNCLAGSEANRDIRRAPWLRIQNLKLTLQFDNASLESREPAAFVLHLPHSFEVEDGQKLAVVGPVGSGKTTLIRSLLRLYEPHAGTLFYRGHDICTLSPSNLRRRVAAVEQQCYFFNESVRNNLLLGSPNSHLDAEELDTVLAMVGMAKEVHALPQGIETKIGEMGVVLSGGQKQRLALARALLHCPEGIILDDSFSEINLALEESILQNLFKAYPRMPLVLATHRLALMPQFNHILVLDEGRLLAQGTHLELLGQCRLYDQLWTQTQHEKQFHAGLAAQA